VLDLKKKIDNLKIMIRRDVGTFITV